MVGHAKSMQGSEKDDEANFGIELNFLNHFIVFSFLVSRVQISVKIEQFPSDLSVH